MPCASIDEVAALFSACGFSVTHHQIRPNPYLAVRHDTIDLDLHYFGIDGFVPEDSYGSCLVLSDDVELLHAIFAAGLRAVHGRLPRVGFPRITEPRRRANADGRGGFSLVDPGGNWIRVMSTTVREPTSAPTNRLAQATANAVVLADSKGDVAQARKILTGALARHADTATSTDLTEAEAFLAELTGRIESQTDEVRRSGWV